MRWERPTPHATLDLDLGGGGRLEVINVHLKAKLPAPIPARAGAGETTVPEPARFFAVPPRPPQMLDHLLVSRPLVAGYRGTEVHNELLHDETIAFASDLAFPESDHAPVVAEFHLP